MLNNTLNCNIYATQYEKKKLYIVLLDTISIDFFFFVIVRSKFLDPLN